MPAKSVKRKGKKEFIPPTTKESSSVLQTSSFYGRSKSGAQTTSEEESVVHASTSEEVIIAHSSKGQRRSEDPQESSTSQERRQPNIGKQAPATQTQKIPQERHIPHRSKSDDRTKTPSKRSSRDRSHSEERTSPQGEQPSELLELHSDDDVDTHLPMGRKKKGSDTYRHFLFTKDIEDELIEWWRDNEFLYNSQLPEFMDKAKKDHTLEAKAKAIGCTSKLYFFAMF